MEAAAMGNYALDFLNGRITGYSDIEAKFHQALRLRNGTWPSLRSDDSGMEKADVSRFRRHCGPCSQCGSHETASELRDCDYLGHHRRCIYLRDLRLPLVRSAAQPSPIPESPAIRNLRAIRCRIHRLVGRPHRKYAGLSTAKDQPVARPQSASSALQSRNGNPLSQPNAP
jgi:hypothetical protein